MLSSPIVSWLDHNHAAYWTAAAAATALYTGWTLNGVRRDLAPAGARPERFLTAALALAALLIAWRWPFWFDPAGLNPDEGQLVAGAQALAEDPVFWRSVDGGTAGPLNFYVLLGARGAGLPVGYATARLIGLLLLGGALFFSYRLLRLFLSAGPARLALLPAALFFALAAQHDFVHYSTEHLPLFLLATGAFLLARGSRAAGGGRLAWWCGGLSLGLLPWAKLQSVPLGAAILLWVGWSLAQNEPRARAEKWRWFGQLLLAGLAPTLLALALVALAGVWPVFLRSYVLQNFHYVADGFTAASLWATTVTSLNQTWHFQASVAGPFLLAILGSGAGLLFGRDPRPGLGSLGPGLFVAALVAVVAPRRPYPHYLLFLVLPLACWFGAVLGALWARAAGARARRRLALGCLVATAGWPLTLRFLQPEPAMIDQLAAARAQPRTAAGEILRAVTQPGDRLGVWGWMSDFYVETGLRQATRQGNTYLCIQPNPQQYDYHRVVYLAELRAHPPAAFIDAVGPGADFFPDRIVGHECFPELAAFIRENYVEFVDVEYARIYVRPDRLAAAGLDATRVRALVASGRRVRGQSAPRAVSVAQDRLSRRTIGGREVTMMLPRAEISWPLDGTERAFHFTCGYDPRAYLEGSSNGTLFTAEITTPSGATYPIYLRLLDPTHHPADRGDVAVQFPLPPVGAGSRLTLRTTPGPEENDVWDWAYLADAAFDHSPLFACTQFPGFNRVPAAVTDDVAYLEHEAGQSVLVMHAPAQLTFRLNGGERSVSFDFGLRAGAYENGGNTDGIGCTVRVRRAGGSETIVFQRRLQPVGNPDDRGRQLADLVLPAGLVAGEELTVGFDSGPDGGAAWDWTWVANLQVR